MNFDPTEAIPFLNRYEPWVQWVIFILLVAFFWLLLFGPKKPVEDALSEVKPSETNTIKSQNISGGINVSGAGNAVNSPGATINNTGISEDTMLRLLNDKSIAANESLMNKYSGGYTIFGFKQGKVVFQTFEGSANMKLDIADAKLSIDKDRQRFTLVIPKIEGETFGTPTLMKNIQMSGRLTDDGNEFMSSIFSFNEYKLVGQVLDSEKLIFVLGFKIDPSLPVNPLQNRKSR